MTSIATIPYQSVNHRLLVINLTVSLIYISWWFVPSHMGQLWLYGLLFVGELYHLIMAWTFWFTMWPSEQKRSLSGSSSYQPVVDIFIPVVNEPLDVIQRTVVAAKDIRYPKKNIYILNDGKSAGYSKWQAIEALAATLEITCLTRETNRGAKAGNINHALANSRGELIVIFDADMVAHVDFLEKTVPYFRDPLLGFVQTPQYYRNYDVNGVTESAWNQQKIFFGPILRGKQKDNAVFICGTNVVIRRTTLNEVGGMIEANIAEDFLTSLVIHQRGWRSYYVSEVLAEGLAPENLQAYYNQQFRWTRGSLEVLFGQNPLLKHNLTFRQKIQYLSSALYYFNGVIVLIDIIMPLLYLYFGIQPVAATTTSFALFFLPFMILNLYTIHVASGKEVSFSTFSFTYSVWFLQLHAVTSALFNIPVQFTVTPKQQESGFYPHLVAPHFVYILIAFIGSIIAINREQLNPSVATNIAWVIFNVALFLPFIVAALTPNLAMSRSRWLLKENQL